MFNHWPAHIAHLLVEEFSNTSRDVIRKLLQSAIGCMLHYLPAFVHRRALFTHRSALCPDICVRFIFSGTPMSTRFSFIVYHQLVDLFYFMSVENLLLCQIVTNCVNNLLSNTALNVLVYDSHLNTTYQSLDVQLLNGLNVNKSWRDSRSYGMKIDELYSKIIAVIL